MSVQRNPAKVQRSQAAAAAAACSTHVERKAFAQR